MQSSFWQIMKDVTRLFCLWSLLALALVGQPPKLKIAILGDRTGETQGAVYADVWKEIRKEKPDFVLSVGDTIQGLGDEPAAEAEWNAVEQVVGPEWWKKLYLAPGNHDIWSEASALLFEKHAGRSRHYSFDAGPVHVTVLDNSLTDQLPAAEMRFLEEDLAKAAARPVKLIVSHRPSWLLGAILRNPEFPLHKLAKRYGVQYVIAGHVHQMLQVELEGVTYVSMPSAGGHLRASKKYEDGWFFGHGLMTVQGTRIALKLHELGGRVTPSSDWGTAGLLKR